MALGLSRTSNDATMMLLQARALSGSLAGVLEILLFHPVDTTAKRLMVDRRAARSWRLGAEIALGKVALAAPLPHKLRAMYPGAGYAMCYKVLQRGLQYTVQPMVSKYLASRQREAFVACFGYKYHRVAEHAAAGCVTGFSEVVFLPIDSLKVRRQTGMPLSLSSSAQSSLWGLVRSAYRGGAWTAARNAVGSCAFFGSAAFTKEWVLQLEDYEAATLGQHFTASIVGAVLSILVACPCDIVKTRMQRQIGVAARGSPAHDAHRLGSGLQIAREIAAREGPSAFFKGWVPKCSVVAPKLMFTYTAANWLYPRILNLQW